MAFKKEVVEIIEPKDVFVGNIKAEVTLEEFGEYESEACAKANEIVKRLLADYDGKIRFNFRHFPLTNIHQRALKAGEAAVKMFFLFFFISRSPKPSDSVNWITITRNSVSKIFIFFQ